MEPTLTEKPSDRARKYLASKGVEVPTTTPTGVVPVAAVENAPPALEIPEPDFDPTSGIEVASTRANNILEQSAKDEEARLAQEQKTESATDTRIKELFGVLGQAPQVEQSLQDQFQVKEKQRIANQIAAEAGLVSDSRKLFDLNTNALSYQARLEASSKDITKRTFNAQDTRFRIERALESNAQAAKLVGLNAQYQIASGDVKLAQESVAQALDIFYRPIETEMEMQKMFFSRNSQRMSDAQRAVAEAQNKKIDRQFKEIDRAITLSDAAVSSGYASGEDIKQLTALSGDPAAQSEFAQQIIAKGAREAAALEKMARNASITASSLTRRKNLVDLALAGDQLAIDELGFDPGAPIREAEAKEQAQEKTQADIVLSKQIENQNKIISDIDKALGLRQGIDASTGLVRSGFLTGMGFGREKATLDTKYGDIQTFAPEGKIGAQGIVQSISDKKEFLGIVNYLLLGEGFQQFSKLKEEGVNLTPVSEFEFKKIQESASLLNSLAEVKDGEITGFGNTSPDVIIREFNAMRESAALIRDEKAAIKNIGYDAYIELQALQQGQ